MRPLSPFVKESLDAAVTIFQGHLADGGPAAEYLRDSRGIDPDWARDHYRVGYVADRSVPGFERFVGRLAIPNICASGTVVGIKFRDLTGLDGSKYDQPAGQSQRIFNTRALLVEGDTIAVTEGEMDAITLGLLGIPAVAIPGANNWNRRRHWRLFEGFRRVILIRDNDEAGGELARQMLATDLPVQVMFPPDGHKDCNAAHVAGCGDDLVRLVTGAIK